MADHVKPVLLVVLDGWGLAAPGPDNAITTAEPACFDALWRQSPHTSLHACGPEVGLPQGRFGNSEVGHLNLGAGRVVPQDITRIDREISEQRFSANPALAAAIEAAKPGGRIHLMGLCSDGGVHSSERHYFALIDWLADSGFDGDRLFFHVITDGRDTSPEGALGYVEAVQEKLASAGVGRIVSICGRYYAMDRDRRWDRTRKAWDLYTLGQGEIVSDPLEAIRDSYRAGLTDEFITPKSVVVHGEALGMIRDGDVVLWFNFRADRARQFCRALTLPDFNDFTRGKQVNITLVTMTRYADDIPATVAYLPVPLRNVLGQWLGARGHAQFRTAETEKYAHVTYFFNGGVEKPFAGEERGLVKSPHVDTYDLQPEMSAAQVAEGVVEALDSGRFPFILVNFANPDMLGHTGIFEAAVAGVRATDAALKRVVDAASRNGCAALITADHGNAEEMRIGGRSSTQHSHNKVPLILAAEGGRRLRDGGALADVAPTVLDLMGIEPPPEMTGASLLTSSAPAKGTQN